MRRITWLPLMLVSLLAAGCQGSRPDGYDPARNETKLVESLYLGDVLGRTLGKDFGNGTLALQLVGPGRQPERWFATLELKLTDIDREAPPILPERPVLSIGPRQFALTRRDEGWPEPTGPARAEVLTDLVSPGGAVDDDEARIKHVGLDDFALLAGGAPLQIDGQEIALTADQRQKIAALVETARQASPPR